MKTQCLFILLFSLLFTQSTLGQDGICNPDPDARERITEHNIPNAYTCFMVMTRGKKKKRYGTGFLIHPRVVLTAGHNLAWYGTGHVNNVDLYFGSIDDSTYLFNKYVELKKGKNKFYKKKYWRKDEIHRDYSVIILPDSSVYKKVGGHFLVQPISEETTLPSTIHITGSPRDKDIHEIWTANTTDYEVSSNCVAIKYDLYTLKRNSGSPIWGETEEGIIAVGVHSRKTPAKINGVVQYCRRGVLINQNVYNQIKRWCAEAGVDF